VKARLASGVAPEKADKAEKNGAVAPEAAE
jgi:hypothetical protein